MLKGHPRHIRSLSWPCVLCHAQRGGLSKALLVTSVAVPLTPALSLSHLSPGASRIPALIRVFRLAHASGLALGFFHSAPDSPSRTRPRSASLFLLLCTALGGTPGLRWPSARLRGRVGGPSSRGCDLPGSSVQADVLWVPWVSATPPPCIVDQ